MRHSPEAEALIEKIETEFLELRVAYSIGPASNVKETAGVIQAACQALIALVVD